MQVQEWYVDKVNRTRMGQYLTVVESELIERFLQPEPAIRLILDVGGGSGRFAVPLMQRGYHVIVTEVDWAPLSALRTRQSSVHAVLTEMNGWPVQAQSVDCVLAMEIPCVYDEWFWRECSRIVKPGGLVIANIVNQASYKGWLYKLRPWLRPFLSARGKRWADRKMYVYTARGVVACFERHGFQLESAAGFNWLPMSRESQSPLIPALAGVERMLGLRQLPFQSPWVLFKARAATRA